MSEYKCAIFGAGNQTTRLLKAIQKSKFEPVILFSRDMLKANKLLLKHEFKILRLTNQIKLGLDDPELTVVFIATPDRTHHEYALKSLKSGMNVFLEKPISIYFDDALNLLRKAIENKLILFIDYHLRCVEPIAYIRDLIITNYFGEINQINIAWHYKPDHISDWRNEKNAWWCSSIRGTHCLDLVLWLFGWDSIIEYTGVLDNSVYNKNDDSCIINLNLKNSIKVTINCSLQKSQPLTLEIMSNRGSFHFDHIVGEGQYINFSEQEIKLFEYENPWEKSVKKFYDFIENNSFPVEEVLSSVVNVFIFENLFKDFFKETQDSAFSLDMLYARLRSEVKKLML